MTLWIFSTHKDLSLSRILEEAKKNIPSFHVIHYEDLAINNGNLWLQSDDEFQKFVDITPNDTILIRWPFDADDTSAEYNIFVHYLLIHYENQIIFDKECLRRFTPYYEDKLFQSILFQKLSIPTPETYYFREFDHLKKSDLTYPLVLKKRVSSRSKNNFLIHSLSDCVEKLKTRNISDYIFQEVIDIVHDVRIVVLEGKIVGAVNRFTHLRENNRLAVKGREVFSDIPAHVEDSVLKIAAFLGADFVGFDVLFDKEGAYYVIEANLSPQFDKFEEATGINVAEKLMKRVLQVGKKV